MMVIQAMTIWFFFVSVFKLSMPRRVNEIDKVHYVYCCVFNAHLCALLFSHMWFLWGSIKMQRRRSLSMPMNFGVSNGADCRKKNKLCINEMKKKRCAYTHTHINYKKCSRSTAFTSLNIMLALESCCCWWCKSMPHKEYTNRKNDDAFSASIAYTQTISKWKTNNNQEKKTQR